MTRLVRYAATVLTLLGPGSTVRAQELWVAGTQTWTNSSRLGDPRGVIAGVGFRRSPALTWRLTYNHLGHDQRRTGVACPGLEPDPVLCPEEPIDDAVTLRGGALGIVTTVARRGGIAFAVIPGVGLYRVRSVSEGLETGNRVSEARSMFGLSFGAELSVSPGPTWPVALHVGAHGGILSAIGSRPTGFYTPFRGEPRLGRVEAGLSIGRRRRAA